MRLSFFFLRIHLKGETLGATTRYSWLCWLFLTRLPLLHQVMSQPASDAWNAFPWYSHSLQWLWLKQENNADVGAERIRGRIMKIKLEMTYHVALCHWCCFAQAFYIDLSLRHCSNCPLLSASIAFHYSQSGCFRMRHSNTHTRSNACVPTQYGISLHVFLVFSAQAHTLTFTLSFTLLQRHTVFLHSVMSFPTIPALGETDKKEHSCSFHPGSAPFSCHCNVILFKLKWNPH